MIAQCNEIFYQPIAIFEFKALFLYLFETFESRAESPLNESLILLFSSIITLLISLSGEKRLRVFMVQLVKEALKTPTIIPIIAAFI